MEWMKAITIYQPWAQLIAVGAKTFETRSWATKHRGPIAIHAGARLTTKQIFKVMEPPALTLAWLALKSAVPEGSVFDGLPRGAVVAVGDLVDVWEVSASGEDWADMAKANEPAFGKRIRNEPNEIAFGDWTPGRYAWELRNVRPLAEPVKALGLQSVWNWNGWKGGNA
jgi:activating signal cointegrator 1